MAESINTFVDGLIQDVHPLMTPNTMLTNVLNGTIITFNGNEFMLQNDMGNGRIETAYLPAGYVPVGVKEYGGIIYIASYNPIKNQSQIGCFPSPERLISSDEMNTPDTELTDALFGIYDTDEYRMNGATSEYQKLEIFDKDQIFNPGDQFMIAIKEMSDDDEDILRRLITNYTLLGYKNITIHLAVIDESGNINYIELDLLKQDNGYWMPYYENDPNFNTQDPDEYRASIGNKDKYNIYKNKISGRLYLIVELEGIIEFDFSRKVKSYVNDITGEETFDVTFYAQSNKYTSQNSVELQGYSFDYNLFEDDNTLPKESQQVYIKDDKTPVNPDINDLITITNIMGQSTNTSGEFRRNYLLKYTSTPYTDFLFLNRFKKSGLINFANINSGVHSLTEWRYFVDNNTMTVAFGFDYNPLEDVSVRRVYFEMYDLSGNYSTYYKCRNRDNWAGNFNEVLTFNDLMTYDNTVDIETIIYNNTDVNRNIILPKNLKVSTKSTVKRNNFYLVRICIEEDLIVNDITKEYKETNFYRFMYSTSIFNLLYLDNFDTILDFGEISPEYNVSITINKTDKNTRIYDGVTSGQFFAFTDALPDDGNLTIEHSAKVYAEADLELSSKLIGYDKDDKTKKYFGEYLSDLIDVGFDTSGTTTLCEFPNDSDMYKTEGYPVDELIPLVTDGIKIDMHSASYSLIGSNKRVTFKLDGTIGRRITGKPSSNLISVSYEGKKLEQYFKDEWLSGNIDDVTEIEKRIAGAEWYGDDTTGGDSNSPGRWRVKDIVPFWHSGREGYSKLNSNGSIDHGNKTFTSDDTVGDSKKLAGFKELMNVKFNDCTVFIASANGDADKDMNMYVIEGDNGEWERALNWNFNGNNNPSENNKFLQVGWKTAGGNGVLNGEYVLINMGVNSWRGDDYDWYNYGGKKYPLAHAIAVILSKFYLVQYKDFKESVYLPISIVYNTLFNTNYISLIKTTNINGTILPIFRYQTETSIFEDFTKTEVMSRINQKTNFPNIYINLNNIPHDTGTNYGNDLIINTTSDSTVIYSFGKLISTILDYLQNYRNPKNYILEHLSSNVFDDYLNTLDYDGLIYETDFVYVKYGDKKFRQYNKIPAGGINFNEICNNGVNYKISPKNEYSSLGTNYSVNLTSSFKANGVQTKDLLNQPWIKAHIAKSEGRGTFRYSSKNKRDFTFQKNILFHSAYAMIRATKSFDNRNANNHNY